MSVSTTRLWDALGCWVSRIPTATELTLTADPQIDDKRSLSAEALPELIPFLEGRTRQTQQLALLLGPTVVTPVLAIDVLPEEKSAEAEALVFVELFWDRPIDPERLAFDTVALGSTQAVHPEECNAVAYCIVEEAIRANARGRAL